jgi:radical SAM superfamily enzyme YgiQ (UPF0313 family)
MTPEPQILHAVLVTPSRYDERGVMVFRLGINQNGSLGAIAGLIEDYNRRQGGLRRISYEIFDEHVREAVTRPLLRRWRDGARARGERFVLLICGVQTPFYPRARDIALMARAEDIDVVAGGVHFTAHGPSVEFLARCGVSIGIGEVEPIWDRLVADIFADTFLPVYRVEAGEGVRVKTAIDDINAPDLTDVPFPHMPRHYLTRYLNPRHLYVDTSRGCPFLCSFCSVKNATGRTMRSREPANVVAWMAERVEQGDAKWFTCTDDNFVRNPRHLEVLEGLAALRARGLDFALCMSLDVDSACHARDDSPRGERTRHFLALCQAAGLSNVSMGLESTNDAALEEMRKNINRGRKRSVADAHQAILDRYRTAVHAFQEIGASVECGYILGFDADRLGAGRRAAEDMMAIGVDIVNFHLIVPLPGAEDYAAAVQQGRLLMTDFNEFYRETAMIAHPTLSSRELEHEFAEAMRLFYSWRRVGTRLAKGLFGAGRPRVKGPWVFAKRQLGFKLMLLMGLLSYAEGGLLRRRTTARREAVTDQEALRHYLGRAEPTRGPILPAAVLDDSRMDSLPVLSRHVMTAVAGD